MQTTVEAKEKTGCEHDFTPYEILPVPHKARYQVDGGIEKQVDAPIFRTKVVKCVWCGKIVRMDARFEEDT